MDDKVKELMDRIRGTASVAADACAGTARVAGKKAGQMVDVAKLNVQLFDLNGEYAAPITMASASSSVVGKMVSLTAE